MTTPATKRGYCHHSFFLTSVSVIYGIAFWSYYTQFPGLLSESGIEPVKRIFRYAFPSLSQRIQDVDTFCELLAVAGMLLSGMLAITTSKRFRRLLAFPILLLLTCLYTILVRTGGAFYSFQWDMLLLETSTITALTYSWIHTPATNPWPLRFLLFKLMFMSGVVKLQAACPTWLHLTALEFHFATQCLPGPLAWHAHQLPPFLLRLGVAITLWMELPLPFLLILPGRYPWRTSGAALQMALQILIVVTGNYNFFNILTMALCLVCLQNDGTEEKKEGSTSSSLQVVEGAKRRPFQFLQTTLCILFLITSFAYMFSLEYDRSDLWRTLNVTLRINSNDCTQFSAWGVPMATASTMALAGLHGLGRLSQAQSDSNSSSSRNSVNRVIESLGIVINTLISVIMIGIMAVPMSTLTPTLRQNQLLKTFSLHHREYFQPYGLANGYGLFRHMTGVGDSSRHGDSNGAGWAGLPPSIVERPEVIMEFQKAGDAETGWTELYFRWKPSRARLLPKQVAPHQPRLDWQLWFAALGRFQQNPWFLNMAHKILKRCPAVLNLLAPEQDFENISAIRAKLYHYDFTRLDTEWNRRIPNANILPHNTSSSWVLPSQIWTRRYVGQYMPAIDLDNHPVSRFLRSNGYDDVCINLGKAMERCGANADGSDRLGCCMAAVIRAKQLHLLIPMLFGIIWVVQERKRLRSVGRESPPKQKSLRRQPPRSAVVKLKQK